MTFLLLIGVAFANVEVSTLGGRTLGRFEGPKHVRQLKQMIEDLEGIPTEFIKIMEDDQIKVDDDILDPKIDYNFNMTYMHLHDDAQNALYEYAEHGQVAQAKYALKCNADINATNENTGMTALVMAADNGHEAVVKILLDAGAHKDRHTNTGLTALIVAARGGHEGVAKLLVDANADIDKHAKTGRTALMFAARDGREGVAKLLVDANANTDIQNQFGETALLYAAEPGHEAIVKILLDAGADTDKQDNWGETPLMVAARNNREGVVKILLAANADKDKLNEDGETAFMLAKHANIKALLQ